MKKTKLIMVLGIWIVFAIGLAIAYTPTNAECEGLTPMNLERDVNYDYRLNPDNSNEVVFWIKPDFYLSEEVIGNFAGISNYYSHQEDGKFYFTISKEDRFAFKDIVVTKLLDLEQNSCDEVVNNPTKYLLRSMGFR